MNQKKHHPAADAFPPVAVATLLILTAWGNAIAMLIVSAVGLIVGAFIYRSALFKGGALVALVAFIIAAAIAIAMATGWFR